MRLSAGTNLGRYEIRSPLGAGGMGEVYLAYDSKLRRPVALKLLSPDLTNNEGRLRRFEQEACAASALNHPNILTIYEVGIEDGANIIATEFIDGLTLRQRMSNGRMSLSEILDVAIQVASALEAAHQAGIVHRDIKPENIMLRRDGYVKVLDFGLAKLTQPREGAADLEEPTRLIVRTELGMLMGTVSYMSPEQARGLEVDQRSDLWSLGVVLYEAIAGRRPFTGETASDVLAAVLWADPPQLAEIAPEVPDELQLILEQSLAKKPIQRYQTAESMRADLSRLKQRFELEKELKGSKQPTTSVPIKAPGREDKKEHSGESAVAPELQFPSTKLIAETNDEGAVNTDNMVEARPTTSAEYIFKTIKEHKKGILTTLGVFIVAVIAVALASHMRLAKSPVNKKAIAQPQNMKLERIGVGGNVKDATISPDGKYIAYVVDNAGQSVWVKQASIESKVQILPPTGGFYLRPSFSPDGNYLFFVKYEGSLGTLYQIPVLGGTPKKLLADIDSPVTFSPDGKHICFARGVINLPAYWLIAANSDGTGEKVLYKSEEGSAVQAPAWSPDGRTIAYLKRARDKEGTNINLGQVRIEDGANSSISSQKWDQYGRAGLSWLSDGTGLIVSASERGSPNSNQLWLVTYPDGEVKRLTNDLSRYQGISLTSDSKNLVTVQDNLVANIWTARRDGSGLKRLTSGYNDRLISWTPDGKVLYVSRGSRKDDIWIMNGDGTNPQQLTINAGNNYGPSASPDGHYIFFASDRSGSQNIWRMDIDGSNQKQLTKGGFELVPQCMADGRWVVYKTPQGDLLKIPADGGASDKLNTPMRASMYSLSPDGKLLAFVGLEDPNNNIVIITSFELGQEIKRFTIPRNQISGDIYENRINWTADGHAVTFVNTVNDVSNVYAQSLDGGAPIRLTNFGEGKIFDFAWSLDGKQLAISRFTQTRDVVLISDFIKLNTN